MCTAWISACRWPFGTFVASTALSTVGAELRTSPVVVVLQFNFTLMSYAKSLLFHIM